jgi:surfeit locus 1 family protein
MRMTFRFRWIPFLACTLAAVVGILLGQWQTRRAHEKEAIEARLLVRASAAPVSLNAGIVDVENLEFRRAIARGEFVSSWPIYLDNRPYNGAAGFYVLMPFKVDGTNRHVLVARGWVKRDIADRAKLPALATPRGVITIEGMLKRDPGHLLQLGVAPPIRPGAILQNLDIKSFSVASGLVIEPLMLEQTSNVADGLVREWPSPSTGVEKHRGYAFQWYALAATAFIFFVVTGFRRGPKQT